MSKRKINQQQQRRIDNKRAKLLDTPQHSGLVLAHHGQTLEIEDAAGKTIVCNKRQNLGTIVTGDKVTWQMEIEGKTGVVFGIEARTTLLSRPDSRGQMHAVAANIDQMFIVIAPTPAPHQTTVDRYLVAAETENIQPIIILNKEDLLHNHAEQARIIDFFQQYQRLGIDTLVLSAKEKQNLSLLHENLANKLSVFVGQSGVGKSSLIETLLPNHVIKTGDLSATNDQGKHTTTTARLYHLPDKSGSIIDSPGIREFPLWSMKPSELAWGFVEFRPLLHDCKFRNCMHVSEPGCALLNAVNEGKISQTRLVSYQKILAGMQEQQHK